MIIDKLQKLGAHPWSIPLTEQDIVKLEAELDAEFPAPYREILLAFGGITFSDAVYYENPSEGGPEQFGGLYDLVELRRANDTPENLPDRLIVVGDDGGGNLYCLGVKGADKGKIFFHDHGVGWDDEAWEYIERGENLPPQLRYQTVSLLANSLGDFVDSLFLLD